MSTSLESDRVPLSLAAVTTALRWPLLAGAGALVLGTYGAVYAALASWAPLYALGLVPEAVGIALLGVVGAAAQALWLVPAELARRYELRPVGWGLTVGALVACVTHLARIGDELLRTLL